MQGAIFKSWLRFGVANPLVLCLALGCRGAVEPEARVAPNVSPNSAPKQNPPRAKQSAAGRTHFVGFDRNTYPGDARMLDLRRHFDFTGYWLTAPPGASTNTWLGKRKGLADAGFGFLVLANGRLVAQIRKASVDPKRLGTDDAAEAVAAAEREGFPPGTVLFLDQEEGGRLLPEQAAYFFAWTEAVAASRYRPGAYLSGQRSPDGTGPDGEPLTITTAQDVGGQIAARHLHPLVLWVAEDTCPPAPGCRLDVPAPAASGTLDAAVWQYAQTPRRPALTRACAKTYAPDGNCYAGLSTDLFLDLDVANTPDPSAPPPR